MKFSVTTRKGYNNKEYGQHGTELVMSITGTQGACVWRLSTGISPMGPWPSSVDHANLLHKVNMSAPTGMGFCAHSELNERTQHDNSSPSSDSCEHLEGRACVCDYSYNLDDKFMVAFACEGFAGVERLLTEHYTEHYGVSE